VIRRAIERLWLGLSAEDQKPANVRIPLLLTAAGGGAVSGL